MPANERRLWPRFNKHIHVLGEVRYVMFGTRQVRALMLYETSVERDAVPAELPPLRGRVIGDMDEIVCTICHRPVVDWLIGDDAIDALIERVQKPVV